MISLKVCLVYLSRSSGFFLLYEAKQNIFPNKNIVVGLCSQLWMSGRNWVQNIPKIKLAKNYTRYKRLKVESK